VASDVVSPNPHAEVEVLDTYWEETMTTLLIVVVVLMLFGGGGYYGYRRW